MKDSKVDRDATRFANVETDKHAELIELDDADLDQVLGIGNDYARARALDHRSMQR